jgi:hypothetical protein
MPNVPRVPGVPNLTGYLLEPLVLLAADLLLPGLGLGAPAWGIFLAGEPAVDVNSVLSMDYRRDWTISDYPVEEGAFQSYDKVQLPYDVRLRVTSGSSIADRQLMIAELDALGDSLELFDVLTPERAYVGVNVSHVGFERKPTAGLGLIVADVWFVEIRPAGRTQFSNTRRPPEAGQQNIGNVQPQPVPSGTFAPNLSFF